MLRKRSLGNSQGSNPLGGKFLDVHLKSAEHCYALRKLRKNSLDESESCCSKCFFVLHGVPLFSRLLISQIDLGNEPHAATTNITWSFVLHNLNFSNAPI